MCFHTKLTKSEEELQKRFDAKLEPANASNFGLFNGFTHPKTPIITHNEMQKIQWFEWGLIPHWAKDEAIQKNTLNARVETLREKPSFKDVLHQRCLVLADGFYEWQWLDAKGKQKRKYEIGLPNQELFAFAGLWSSWTDKNTGEIRQTYTIITTEANELMSRIHNTKKRMPIILAASHEKDWLQKAHLVIQNDRLVGEGKDAVFDLFGE